MGRPQNPKRKAAFEIYKLHNGNIKLKDIAAQLELSDSNIRKWKSQDKWDEVLKLNRNVTKSKKRNVTKKEGAPYGNRNACGAHKKDGYYGNQNAVKHGLYSKYMPKETLELFEELEVIEPIDILWQNIKIAYAAIIRAQNVMYVEKDEIKKEIKKETRGDKSDTTEWNFHFAYERQEQFLQAQAKAQGQLNSMIKQYQEMLKGDLDTEERRARINKIVAETNKINGNDDEGEGDDGFLDAMKESVAEVWMDEPDEES